MSVTLLGTQTSQTSGQTSNTLSLGTLAAKGTVTVSALIGNSSVSLASGIASVIDNHGNTYVKQEEITRANNVWEALFSFDYGAAPGATTLTITYGTSNGNISFTKAALDDGTDTSGSFDIGATNAGLSDMSATSPDVTTSPTSTAAASETVVTALGVQSGTALTSWPPTGYTAISTTQTNTTRGFSMAMAYLAVSSTGVQSADCGAQGATIKWAFVLGAFKQATGGAPASTVATDPIGSSEAFGADSASRADLAASIAPAETFGAPALARSALASETGPAEAFGTATVYRAEAAVETGSGEAFGADVVARVEAEQSIASAEAFGAPAVTRAELAAAIASAEAFGGDQPARELDPQSVPSGEMLDRPLVAGGIVGNPTVFASEIPSGEAFGTAALARAEQPQPVGSGETVAPPQPARVVAQAGSITSGEAVGTPGGVRVLAVVEVASGEAFGSDRDTLDVFAVGITSGEQIPLPFFADASLVKGTGYGSMSLSDERLLAILLGDRATYALALADAGRYALSLSDEPTG